MINRWIGKQIERETGSESERKRDTAYLSSWGPRAEDQDKQDHLLVPKIKEMLKG